MMYTVAGNATTGGAVARVCAVTNQKGGVGKTTTAVNLAASLAAMDQRVCLIDLDPQGNATLGFGLDVSERMGTMSEVLLDEAPMLSVALASTYGVTVCPADHRLTVAEVRLVACHGREFRLQQALTTLAEASTYDWVLIDCPPALNVLTVNALVAANALLVPVQCEYFALEGLTALLSTIEEIKRHVNPSLGIEGLVRTMYDGRNRLTRDVSQQLMDHFGDHMFQSIIPRNVRLAEAPSHGMPALHYDRHAQGAVAYLALAAELLHRHEASALTAPSEHATHHVAVA